MGLKSVLTVLAGCALAWCGAAAERRLSVADYRDKMKAGWVGQIAGVCFGAPTEFKWCSKIIPADRLPVWKPEMINNAFDQDDLYVEMTFLKTMEDYGLDVDIRQAGIDFANSRYKLWCANAAGRTNLRRGIAPPDSSHPKFNKCPNDIDYQIEADFAGLISPGLPQSVIRLGNVFGRLMNYGDGVYGGQFMGALYAESFFTADRFKVIETALASIPAESQYAEMVRDMVAWYKAAPKDWQGTWQKAVKKYRHTSAYQKASNGNIDVKINGAMVLLGYLYGEGDLDETIKISTRGGFDSDCNPSSAAGALFTAIGFSKLPARFSEKLDNAKKFSYTAYNFPALLDVCEKLARQVVVKEGGRIEKDAAGAEWFVIPEKSPVPNALELSWAPGPCANARFTPGEYAKIDAALKPDFLEEKLADADPTKAVQKTLDELFKGWKTSTNLKDMSPGYRASLPRENGGKEEKCVLTHPATKTKAVTLSRTLAVPAKKPVLRFRVASDPRGDFVLGVRVAGEEIFSTVVTGGNAKTMAYRFHDFEVPLARWAGQNVTIELVDAPNGWSWEAAVWSRLEVNGGK